MSLPSNVMARPHCGSAVISLNKANSRLVRVGIFQTLFLQNLKELILSTSRRTSAALLLAAFFLAACQGGTSSHLTPTSAPATGKGHAKPQTVVSNQCVPVAGQTVGTITEYSVPGTDPQPFGLTADQNGNIWVAEWNVSSVGKFNISSHAWNTYLTPTRPSEPIRIAIGPDGNPWTTEVYAGKIAKFNLSSSSFTEYSAYGGGSSLPEWIDNAPAGTANAGLWVSLNAENKLSNISTSGAQTVHTSQTSPYGLSSDSLGNIWYTTLTGNKIGVQRVDGTTGSWTVPTSSSGPYGITEGPSGTGMWFAESTGNKIGSISSTGTFSEYAIPTASSHPLEVVSACGNIWFTEYDANKIGELNPNTGSITEYSVPTTSSEPTGITADANGNVWFTERNGNKLAMIATVGAAASPPDGSMYVLNDGAGTVVNYAAGNYVPPPAAEITGIAGSSPGGSGQMAFDSSGDLWVTNGAAVSEYAPGASGAATPLTTFTPTDTTASAIAVDSSGEIILASGANNAIYVYAAGSSGTPTPLRTISGSLTDLSGPVRLIIDGSDNVWVANSSVAGISEFPASANGNVAPTLYLGPSWASANGISGVNSLAIDASGELLVLGNDGEHVFTFPAGVTPTTLYTRQMATQQMADIAVDDLGYVYGSAQLPYGVLIYSPGASGTPAPYASISASNDGIRDPNGIAVWTGSSWWYGGDARHRHGAVRHAKRPN
jgi:virginiamycin B lyase